MNDTIEQSTWVRETPSSLLSPALLPFCIAPIIIPLIEEMKSILIPYSIVSSLGFCLRKRFCLGCWPLPVEVTWRGQYCHGGHQSAKACPEAHPSFGSNSQSADGSSIFNSGMLSMNEWASDLEKPLLVLSPSLSFTVYIRSRGHGWLRLGLYSGDTDPGNLFPCQHCGHQEWFWAYQTTLLGADVWGFCFVFLTNIDISRFFFNHAF